MPQEQEEISPLVQSETEVSIPLPLLAWKGCGRDVVNTKTSALRNTMNLCRRTPFQHLQIAGIIQTIQHESSRSIQKENSKYFTYLEFKKSLCNKYIKKQKTKTMEGRKCLQTTDIKITIYGSTRCS